MVENIGHRKGCANPKCQGNCKGNIQNVIKLAKRILGEDVEIHSKQNSTLIEYGGFVIDISEEIYEEPIKINSAIQEFRKHVISQNPEVDMPNSLSPLSEAQEAVRCIQQLREVREQIERFYELPSMRTITTPVDLLNTIEKELTALEKILFDLVLYPKTIVTC